MAKQTRQKATPTRRKKTRPAAPGAVARPRAHVRAGGGKPRQAKPATSARKTATTAARKIVRSAPAAAPPPSPPAAPPRKPGYYEALAMYENGVRALQRHDYEGAAGQFRLIIERYPAERELLERSQLYLRVCDRETARRPAAPQTAQERVYAATVALNAGDPATALDHLRRALTDSPDSDHAHYIMAVALAASAGPSADALEHLRRAITLNPENRALARQDPDLETLRAAEAFRDLVNGTSSGEPRSKARKRR